MAQKTRGNKERYPSESERAVISARAWFTGENRAAADARDLARFEELVGEHSFERLLDTIEVCRVLFEKWLSSPIPEGPYRAESVEHELVGLLVALRAWRQRPSLSIISDEPGDAVDRLVHGFVQARTARALLRLSTHLVRPGDFFEACCGSFDMTPTPRTVEDVWREASERAHPVAHSDVRELERFNRIGEEWKAWLAQRLLRGLTVHERASAITLVLQVCTESSSQQRVCPWFHAVAYAQFLWNVDRYGEHFAPALPAGMSGDLCSHAGRLVRVHVAQVDVVAEFKAVQERGIGLQWRRRTIALAQREHVDVSFAPTPGLRVGTPSEEPVTGSLWKEECEVSLGVVDRRIVFLTTDGRRFVVDVGQWRWHFDATVVEGILDAWKIGGDRARLHLEMSGPADAWVDCADIDRVLPLTDVAEARLGIARDAE